MDWILEISFGGLVQRISLPFLWRNNFLSLSQNCVYSKLVVGVLRLDIVSNLEATNVLCILIFS